MPNSKPQHWYSACRPERMIPEFPFEKYNRSSGAWRACRRDVPASAAKPSSFKHQSDGSQQCSAALVPQGQLPQPLSKVSSGRDANGVKRKRLDTIGGESGGIRLGSDVCVSQVGCKGGNWIEAQSNYHPYEHPAESGIATVVHANRLVL